MEQFAGTLFRNQIQPKRSGTDQFSSNYYILHIYMSFLKKIQNISLSPLPDIARAR